MSDPLELQQTLFHTIARALENFKKLGKNNYTPAKIQSRLTYLKETWNRCRETHAILLRTYPIEKREKIDYFKTDQMEIYEDLYQAATDYMVDCLEEVEPSVSSNRSFNNTSISSDNASLSLKHLPPIQLPPFSGNYEEWETFRDRFDALIIQNQELSNFSRMHFLASSLTGRARSAISSLSITADNFEVAWKALVARFENKRRLIELHVSTLYHLPSLARESASDLHSLLDKADKAFTSLKRLKRSSDDILNDILVYFVSQKLDPATRRAWKLKFTDDSPPATYDDLNNFISSRALALDELKPIKQPKIANDLKVTSANATPSQEPVCVLCQKRHFINKCAKCIDKSSSQRRDIVKQHKRCFNCLSVKHSVADCKSRFTCRFCQQKHHTMLHVDSLSSSTPNVAPASAEQPTTSAENAPVNALSAISSHVTPSPVLLATAKVIVRAPSGREQTVRALLDQGSEVTFITENLAQLLRLRRIRTLTTISAVGCVKAGVCRHAAQIQITPRHKSGPTFNALAFVMKSLSNYSPRRMPIETAWNHLRELKLADDDLTGSDPINLLIGADLYSNIILEGVRKGEVGQPIAQNSHFGWVVSGPTSTHISASHSIQVMHCALEQELRRFWEIEELPHQILLSAEDRRCEEHFLTHYSRDKTGRYIVRLPFKTGPPIDIGESRTVALQMLTTLTRRLNRHSDLKREYDTFLEEYERLGHTERILEPSMSHSQTVYIPHHAVVRASSATTRVRVVFNASCLTTNGTSLNSHLLAGPKLQTNLFDVLLRWRQYQYVYTADIAKMYRQIIVDPRDRDYQRIIWSPDAQNPPQDYRLCTVTYGSASAPFLALRVIRQLLSDEGSAYPLAVSILTHNIYVDDVLFGAEDIPLLRHAREQVCALLQRGGFKLRKWASNNSDLLKDIAADDHGLACDKVLQPDENLNVLGITWNPALDVFKFQVLLPASIPRTKRSILSTIAKLFDPLGWATPITISTKIFMQQLWRLKLAWDDDIPEQSLDQWETLYEKLSSLHGLKLPRWIHRGSDTRRCELHGFADASSVAYAAVVYIRVTSLSGEVTTALLAGKSKVAPIKPVTIPRLELCAAVLLSKLMESIQLALNIPELSYHCWTDSTVVLAWLSQTPDTWKTFVSHRVAAIQSRVSTATWRHVPSNSNPADCASRGLLNTDLATYALWWNGPPWHRSPPSEWPTLIPSEPVETPSEARAATSHLTAQPEEPWILASRYSEWSKLLRVTAYIFRFVLRCQRRAKLPADLKSSPFALSVNEYDQAKWFWLRVVQAAVLPEDLKTLQRQSQLSSRSAIISLNPFLDDNKLIRVGGRIANAPLPFNTKHPIILVSHPIVTMIIRNAHVRSLHAGPRLTLSTLRQEYWILRARTLVKAILHQCVTCTRERATTAQQLMGQLPLARVSAPGRAFLHCGVDFAGPIAVRASAGRGIKSRKAYIAVFICLATRAIHLELVGNYSAAAFLDAFTRFCARRGLPTDMYSDNGTNFVGANKELTKAYRDALRDPDFLNQTASDKVCWHFIPPHAPHFGGLWEAGVRSVKYHLKRVIGSHTLTFEELTTLLCKIEACLNSRPLEPMTTSSEDLDPLTPGHFLIGAAMNVHPEPSVLHLRESRLSRWQLVRQMIERFWKIWQADYINTLQQRAKWRRTQSSVRVGNMVLIRNATLPPCKWELGRVTQCFTGSDGLVRVVLVKTASSEYKRPIHELCVLPIDANSDGPATVRTVRD